MVFLLLGNPFAVQPVEGGRALEFCIVDGHICPDGTVVNGFSEEGDGNPGIPDQEPGVVAHLGGKGVEGYVGGMGSKDGQGFLRGQAGGILQIDPAVVADTAPRSLVIGFQKAGKPVLFWEARGFLLLA